MPEIGCVRPICADCQRDTVLIEFALCEDCSTVEVELHTVTISNISIDNKSVETNGKRGRYREITVDFGAGGSFANAEEWPNVVLKPSKSSVKGQRYVGP